MYEKELEFLERTLKSAYERYAEDHIFVSEKAKFDIVTNIDRSIECYFKNELEKSFPEDRILGEEYSSDLDLSDRTWILDPIDGTFNFSVCSQLFGLQAALWDNGDLQISSLYLPMLNEFYVAKKNGGAYCNGQRLCVSKRAAENAIVSFGDLPHARPKDAEDELKMIQKTHSSVAKIRMFGAACVDFAYLASGKTEAVVLYTKNKWDLAPGLLLSREAGALCFNVEGGEYDFDCRGIVACNSEEIFNLIKITEK